MDYEARYQAPTLEFDRSYSPKGYIRIEDMPDVMDDISWGEWLTNQLAGICLTMIPLDSYILDDEGNLVPFHHYLMVLNEKWRKKIEVATIRLNYLIGSCN